MIGLKVREQGSGFGVELVCYQLGGSGSGLMNNPVCAADLIASKEGLLFPTHYWTSSNKAHLISRNPDLFGSY